MCVINKKIYLFSIGMLFLSKCHVLIGIKLDLNFTNNARECKEIVTLFLDNLINQQIT